MYREFSSPSFIFRQSSILNVILGELKLSSGTRIIKGSIAYVPQEAWVLADTVRKNIILDFDFDEKKYLDILVATTLIVVNLSPCSVCSLNLTCHLILVLTMITSMACRSVEYESVWK